MARYMIQAITTGEVYVTDGTHCTLALDHRERDLPLADYALDHEADDSMMTLLDVNATPVWHVLRAEED